MIEARNLHKVYRNGPIPVPVLNGIELTVADGEFLAITGPSGAGKSTLLHLLAGLDMPTDGDVVWDGRSLAQMTERARASLRNQAIGFVFQFYHLLPELSALENVMLPGLVNGRRSRHDLRERAVACLTRVGLQPRIAHTPARLSGGELQRVAIARALMNRPKVIFCDEPTGNLDSQTGALVIQLLLEVHRSQQVSLVLVTHEEAFARLASRRLLLRDGQFVQPVAQ